MKKIKIITVIICVLLSSIVVLPINSNTAKADCESGCSSYVGSYEYLGIRTSDEYEYQAPFGYEDKPSPTYNAWGGRLKYDWFWGLVNNYLAIKNKDDTDEFLMDDEFVHYYGHDDHDAEKSVYNADGEMTVWYSNWDSPPEPTSESYGWLSQTFVPDCTQIGMYSVSIGFLHTFQVPVIGANGEVSYWKTVTSKCGDAPNGDEAPPLEICLYPDKNGVPDFDNPLHTPAILSCVDVWEDYCHCDRFIDVGWDMNSFTGSGGSRYPTNGFVGLYRDYTDYIPGDGRSIMESFRYDATWYVNKNTNNVQYGASGFPIDVNPGETYHIVARWAVDDWPADVEGYYQWTYIENDQYSRGHIVHNMTYPFDPRIYNGLYPIGHEDDYTRGYRVRDDIDFQFVVRGWNHAPEIPAVDVDPPYDPRDPDSCLNPPVVNISFLLPEGVDIIDLPGDNDLIGISPGSEPPYAGDPSIPVLCPDCSCKDARVHMFHGCMDVQTEMLGHQNRYGFILKTRVFDREDQQLKLFFINYPSLTDISPDRFDDYPGFDDTLDEYYTKVPVWGNEQLLDVENCHPGDIVEGQFRGIYGYNGYGDLRLTWTTVLRDWSLQRMPDRPWQFKAGGYNESDLTPPVFAEEIQDQTICSGQSFRDIKIYVEDKECGHCFTGSPDDFSNMQIIDDGDCAITVILGGSNSIIGETDPHVAVVTYPEGWTGSETITFKATDPTGRSGYENATFTVLDCSNQPCIRIVKTASSDEVLSGETVVYTYEVTNIGNADLTNVVVYDDKLGEITRDSVGDEVLNPGETWTYTASTALFESTTNVGTVSAVVLDDSSIEVSDSDDASVCVISGDSELVVSKKVKCLCGGDYKDSVTVGFNSTVEFKLSVENIGDSELTVNIEDELPSGLEYVVGSASIEPVVDGKTLSWSISLAASDIIDIVFDAKAVDFGEFENIAVFEHYNSGDITPETKTVSDSATVVVECPDGPYEDFSVMMMNPSEDDPFVYIKNVKKFPFIKNMVFGAIDLEATVVDSNSLNPSITSVKFYVKGEEKASIPFVAGQSGYVYRWDERALFWNEIEVAAFAGSEKVASQRLNVFAIIL